MSDIINPSWPNDLIEPMLQDRRNVIDHYKYWHTDAIRADLDKRRHSFAVLTENLAHDFNIGTVIRNANAFLASEVWIAGRRSYDRRGAVGAYHYENISYAPTSAEVIKDYKLRGYTIVAMDNQDGANNIYSYDWPEKSLMIFGQEQIGISPEALALANDCLYIPQFGSVRSLNVGVASGLSMFSWAARHALV